jgi:hypothetical protein
MKTAYIDISKLVVGHYKELEVAMYYEYGSAFCDRGYYVSLRPCNRLPDMVEYAVIFEDNMIAIVSKAKRFSKKTFDSPELEAEARATAKKLAKTKFNWDIEIGEWATIY